MMVGKKPKNLSERAITRRLNRLNALVNTMSPTLERRMMADPPKTRKAPRTTASCPGPNNLPPLTFHSVHGDNIRISRDGKIARRYESFCKGVTFSARPVKVNERVCVKFAEISNNWSGVIRFGFTCIDPSTLSGTLPKYACPDLTNKPGFWGKALHERYCQRNNVLFYYVTSSGEVHYGINGEEKGLFITDVDTRGPLWSMIDIYGNSTACEFLDSRTYMCNGHGITPAPALPAPNQTTTQAPQVIGSTHEVHDMADRMQSLFLSNDSIVPFPATVPIVNPVNRRQTIHSSNNSVNSALSSNSLMAMRQPIQFHSTRGRNVLMESDRTVAIRADSEFCQGYVFTNRPINCGEQFVIQILKTDNIYGGSLAIGLTSCNPASLAMSDLPDDSDNLLDRPEYWVVSKDLGQIVQMHQGDEIKFTVTVSGEVQISRNDNAPITLMFIDQSLQLWAFFDVYGSTQSIRVLSQPSLPVIYQQLVAMPGAQASGLNRGVARPGPATATTSIISGSTNGDIQVQSSGTVLVVNLPMPQPDVKKTLPRGRSQPRLNEAQYSNQNLYATVPAKKPSSQSTQVSATSVYSSLPNYNSDNPNGGFDCTICYENPIDSVLYMCGHMCMCYNCAIKHWRGGAGGGVCPLCRAPIKDVIRTYKS